MTQVSTPGAVSVAGWKQLFIAISMVAAVTTILVYVTSQAGQARFDVLEQEREDRRVAPEEAPIPINPLTLYNKDRNDPTEEKRHFIGIGTQDVSCTPGCIGNEMCAFATGYGMAVATNGVLCDALQLRSAALFTPAEMLRVARQRCGQTSHSYAHTASCIP